MESRNFLGKRLVPLKEVYGAEQGHGVYACFDFYTGRLLWTFTMV